MSRFALAPLQDAVAVGLPEPEAVRLWVRSDRPGPLDVRWGVEGEPLDGRASVALRGRGACALAEGLATLRVSGLRPATAYRFEVHAADGRAVGDGRFRTCPRRGGRLSFAFLSCHLPFDDRGRVKASASAMLDATLRLLRDRGIDLVLAVGDQMYADYPPSLSLFDAAHFRSVAPPGRERLLDCTAEEARRLFQDRYRVFWNVPQWRSLQSRHACLPIWDDHEIVDNWGAAPEHLGDDWQRVFAGARAACFDYQAARTLEAGATLPDDFDYSFEYGDAAFHVMDLRSNRRLGERGGSYSSAQRERLERFLREHADRAALFLVLSVPLVHLPRPLASAVARLPPQGEDFSDRWSSLAHARDRDVLLRLLHDHAASHPEQLLVTLSGDIHIGCAHTIVWSDGAPGLHQLVSSAVTNEEARLLRWASARAISLKARLRTRDGLAARVRVLPGAPGLDANPYEGLNVGVVEVDAADRPAFRFHLYGERDGAPLHAFESPWVAAGAGLGARSAVARGARRP